MLSSRSDDLCHKSISYLMFISCYSIPALICKYRELFSYVQYHLVTQKSIFSTQYAHTSIPWDSQTPMSIVISTYHISKSSFSSTLFCSIFNYRFIEASFCSEICSHSTMLPNKFEIVF